MRHTLKLFFMLLFTGRGPILLSQEITELEYPGRSHFWITSDSGTYLLDRAGDGFFSIQGLINKLNK